MDWSLALVSQGIETTIDFSDEAGWGLLVSESESDRALAVIRQYRTENLRWPWRRKILPQQILFDWGSLAWVALLGAFFWLEESGADLRGAGAMDAAAVSRGEWWRLFTAIFLHADLGHLAANASLGLILLGLALARCGTGVGLLAALLAGAGGNVAGWLVDKSHRSLGASGLVMGALGLLAAQSLWQWRRMLRAWRHLLGGAFAGGMLFVLLGLSPGTDMVAHFGGFVSGLVLGGMLALTPRLTQSSAANLFAGAAFALLTILTWWLALRGGN